MFKNRKEAGRALASIMNHYCDAKDTLILGLPRGGVVVAYELSKFLKLPLDIIVSRKIGAPGNKELAIGAVTPDGNIFLDKKICELLNVSKSYIDQEVEKEMAEATRRLHVYRGDRPELNLDKKVVILVDDGIATGATIRVAIKFIRTSGAKKIIVAVPVAPPEIVEALKKEVDEVVCIDMPSDFFAIGAHYLEFKQVEDDEVIAIMAVGFQEKSMHSIR